MILLRVLEQIPASGLSHTAPGKSMILLRVLDEGSITANEVAENAAGEVAEGTQDTVEEVGRKAPLQKPYPRRTSLQY